MTLKFTYQIINNLKFNFFLLFSHPFSFTLLQHPLTLTKYNQSRSRSDHCVILLLVTVLSLSLSLSLSTLFFLFFYKSRQTIVTSIYKKRECANINLYSAFGLFNPYYSSGFFFYFFSLPVLFVLICLSLFFNIYYLHVHIQFHRLNKFLQYFPNYLTICTVHQPFFFLHSMLVLLVLFQSFLLNIYMCIHSYTDTTHSYNIFTIIEVSIF